jgi:FAD/FMN-containing dehydrogenase
MSNFAGSFWLKGDEGFEEAAVGRVFNGRRPKATERRPEAVLYPESDDDLKQAVKLAKEQGWSLAMRSGGHSWAAWSVQNGTMLIDMSRLQEATYDEATGIASARPAIKGGEVLDPFLEKHDRYFNGGHCPTVAIGGFLLQGGQGYCARGMGWAAEHVVAVEVLTAEGEIVRCDATQNQDLYWAARGAGPSFPGIVTRFHLQTKPRYKAPHETIQIFEIDEFAEVMKWIYEVHEVLAPTIELVVVSACPLDENGTPGKRMLIVDALALVDSKEEAEAALAPMRTNPLLNQAVVNVDCGETSMAERKRQQVEANPEGARYFVDNIWVDGETETIIDGIAPLFTDLPEPQGFTIWFSMGPIRELPDMAFSMQTPGYVATYLVSEDESRDGENRAWLNSAMAGAQSVTVGQYLGDSDMTNRQVKFMADENFARLQQIIAERDPANLFVRYLAKDPSTVNQNHWQI